MALWLKATTVLLKQNYWNGHEATEINDTHSDDTSTYTEIGSGLLTIGVGVLGVIGSYGFLTLGMKWLIAGTIASILSGLGVVLLLLAVAIIAIAIIGIIVSALTVFVGLMKLAGIHKFQDGVSLVTDGLLRDCLGISNSTVEKIEKVIRGILFVETLIGAGSLIRSGIKAFKASKVAKGIVKKLSSGAKVANETTENVVKNTVDDVAGAVEDTQSATKSLNLSNGDDIVENAMDVKNAISKDDVVEEVFDSVAKNVAKGSGNVNNIKNNVPNTRSELHNDLISKGFKEPTTSQGGYITYKHPNGNKVTIKPDGEVIPTVRVQVDPTDTARNAPKYNQRTTYDGTYIDSHSTGHYIDLNK